MIRIGGHMNIAASDGGVALTLFRNVAAVKRLFDLEFMALSIFASISSAEVVTQLLNPF